MRTTSTTCSATSARSALNGPGRVFDRAVVVIPAHNEADNLPTSVKAVLTAAACLPLPVAVIVVLDGCDDGSAALAGQFGSDVHFVAIDTRNVGAARAVGFLRAHAVRTGGARRFADLVCHYRRRYRHGARRSAHCDLNSNPDGHGHVHGANMGFRADSYWRVCGFAALASDEDVDLVARFESAGLRIVRDAQLSVVTSRRQLGRAPDGFAAHLRSLLAHARAERA
jgi:glycosyltransferase involved in cell wall biosynthesis